VGATAKDSRGRVVLGLTYTVFKGLTQVVEVVLRKKVAGNEVNGFLAQKRIASIYVQLCIFADPRIESKLANLFQYQAI
jgi:hypothetical protein